MQISRYTLFLVSCLIIVLSGSTCDCTNQKANNNPSPQPTLVPPLQHNNTADVAQAIQELEQEATSLHADPRLQDIYKVIHYLPPCEFIQNADGSLSRINKEKNGRELFDKIIDNLDFNDAMNLSTAEAVAWLIDTKLLTPNEIHEQDNSPLLEKVALAWITAKSTASTREAVIKILVSRGAKLSPEKSSQLVEKLIEEQSKIEYPRKDHDTIFNFLKNQGAQLPAEKASQLLESFINQLLDRYEPAGLFDPYNPKTLPPELLKEFLNSGKKIAKFLQEQGGKIPPAKSLDLLGKLIQKNNPQFQELATYIINPTQQVNTPAEVAKITALLQQAVEKEQGPEVYKLLLDQGADPNIMVKKDTYSNKELPLLHYVGNKSYEPGYKELFQKLLQNPVVQINKSVGIYGHSLAMSKAYEHRGSTAVVEALLTRADLDINTIQSQAPGTMGYTLLDMVIENCMVIPTGHDDQKKTAMEDSKRWLATLKKMQTHPNFKITINNLQEAEKKYKERQNGVTWSPYKQEILATALEALNIIKNGPKQN